MKLILLNLLVMVVQAYLGEVGWQQLLAHWLVAGVLTGLFAVVLHNNRYVASGTPFVKLFSHGWVLMTLMLNLCSACLVAEHVWWQPCLYLVGFALIVMGGYHCWQTDNCPLMCLGIGAMLGLLTLVSPLALSGLLVGIVLLMHMRSFSLRNVCSIVSGLLTVMWLIYATLFLAVGESAGSAYLQSLTDPAVWATPSRPVLVLDRPTDYVFLFGTAFILLVFLVIGYLNTGSGNLRTHAAVKFLGTLSVLCLLTVPLAWPLYVPLLSITVAGWVMFALGNGITGATGGCGLVVGFYVLTSVLEPAVRYIITII